MALEKSKYKSSCANISIPCYDFLGVNSKTRSGGVGLYISKNIQYIRRPDLDFSSHIAESCWVELPHDKAKNSIIAGSYRHPSSNIGDSVTILHS